MRRILSLVLSVSALLLMSITWLLLRKPVSTERKDHMERTLAIIKPDAVMAKNTGNIVNVIENNDFSIVAMYKTRLTREKAENFYAVHKGKGFFNELVNFMASGPIVVLVLEKEDAVKAWRNVMGDTNPANAAPGTIRNLYGTSIGSNAVHGSDATTTATDEIAFFFPNV